MSASASVVGSDDTAPVGALAAQEDLDDMVREATEEELHEADNDASDVAPAVTIDNTKRGSSVDTQASRRPLEYP